VLALAALAAGEDRNLIRSFLAQFEENKPTLLMLQAVDFRVPPTVPDYAGR